MAFAPLSMVQIIVADANVFNHTQILGGYETLGYKISEIIS
jgi:hypothetical protein